MLSIHLEPAIQADAEELVTLRISAMRESLERIGRFDPQRARERFLAGFSPQHTRHICDERSRIGFVVVKPENDGLLLDHLYILPRKQKAGVGSAVLMTVFEEADLAQLPIRVGALKGSDSNRFYLRHGFEPVEEAQWDNYYARAPRNEAR